MMTYLLNCTKLDVRFSFPTEDSEGRLLFNTGTGYLRGKDDMDKELEHIWDVLDIGVRNRKRLLDEGFATFEDIVTAKERLGRKEVGEVKGSVQTDLHDLVCWCQDFFEQYGQEPNILVHFREEVLVDFQDQKENKKALVSK
jgi:hypothetical protein